MSDPYDDLRRYAASLREESSEEAAGRAVTRAVSAPVPRRLLRPAVVAAAALVLGNGALAAAADPAVPGDVLYGVDRAYERLGELVGVDHAPERVAEASELAARGRYEDAAAVLDELPSDRDDLREAVESLRETVADNVGFGAGEEISEKAREIGEAAPGRPDDIEPGPPEGSRADPLPGPPDGSPADPSPGPPAHGDGETPGPPAGTPPEAPRGAPGGHPDAPPAPGPPSGNSGQGSGSGGLER